MYKKPTLKIRTENKRKGMKKQTVVYKMPCDGKAFKEMALDSRSEVPCLVQEWRKESLCKSPDKDLFIQINVVSTLTAYD